MAHLPAIDGRLRSALACAGVILALAIAPSFGGKPATAEPLSPPIEGILSPGRAFVETDGASLYANICQGCHMRDGRGATGAAAYPSLAANADLQSTAFVTEVVLKGVKGMPALGRSMADDQVAAVVNYVRSHFGNSADTALTSAEVKAMRAP